MTIYDQSGQVLYSWDDASFEPGIDLDGLDLSNANLSNFCFDGLMLTETCFRGADMSRASLYWATFLDSDMESTNLEGSDMRGIHLIRCNLRHANLRGADLGCNALGARSSLDGSDLSSADLTDATMLDAVIDDQTRLPDGFDQSLQRLVHRDSLRF